MSTARNLTLDCAKGVGIILVVFGHAVARNVPDPTSVWYWASIQEFHMALFMFISGFVAYGKLDAAYVSRRFLQLIPPYCAWTLVFYYWSTFAFSGLAGNIYTDGGPIWSFLKTTWASTGLWFFPILFALCLLMYLVRGNLIAILAISAGGYAITQIPALHLLNFGIGRMAWFMPVFASGYFLAKHQQRLAKFGHVKWFCLIAFPICFVLAGEWNYTPWASLYRWPDLETLTSNGPLFAFYFAAMSFLGIGMAFAVVAVVQRIRIMRRSLLYLGLITVGIYPAHLLWLKIGVGTGVAKALSVTAVSLVLSIAVIWILRRFKITDYLFLGGAQRLLRHNAGLRLRSTSASVRGG